MLDAASERYRMLETVREYAREQLERADELAPVRSRHLEYYLALAESARRMLFGPEQGTWLRRLDAEREDLLAAHAWCDRDPHGVERGLRLVSATKVYWMNRGLVRLAQRITLEALSRPSTAALDAARCKSLFDLGQCDLAIGDLEGARRHLEQSLSMARDLGDVGRIGAALQPLGLVHLELGDRTGARKHLEEGLIFARDSGNLREVAAALTALAQLDRVEGRIDDAESRYAEALALVRGLGDRTSIAIGLLNLAMVAIARGDPARAREMLVEATEIVLETGSRKLGQSTLDIAAGLAAHVGDWQRSARLFGAADTIAVKMAVPREAGDEVFLQPLRAAGRAALAPDALASAEAAGRGLDFRDALTEAHDWLARGS